MLAHRARQIGIIVRRATNRDAWEKKLERAGSIPSCGSRVGLGCDGRGLSQQVLCALDDRHVDHASVN